MFKVNNKDTRTTSGASVVNVEHILHFILLLLFLNFSKYSKSLVSDNKFVFNNCEKYIVLSAGKILFSSLFTQHKAVKRIHFHDSASKR